MWRRKGKTADRLVRLNADDVRKLVEISSRLGKSPTVVLHSLIEGAISGTLPTFPGEVFGFWHRGVWQSVREGMTVKALPGDVVQFIYPVPEGIEDSQ